MPKGVRQSPELNIDAVRAMIVECGGLISTVAKRLGLSVSALNKWLDTHPALRDELAVVRADVAEKTRFKPDPEELRNAILAYDGNLTRIGKHFGFNGDTVAAYLKQHPDLEKLVEDTRQLIAQQHQRAIFSPDTALVLDAIDALRGNVGGVAMRFHVSRNTMLNYINARPELQAAVYEAHEKTLDMVETTLENRALAGDAWAVCCAEGTLVTMADGGIKLIENIKPGDTVITHTGLPGLVLCATERPYNGEVVELQVNKLLRKLVVTPEHPILSTRIARANSIWWHEAGALRIGDFVHCATLNAFSDITAITRKHYIGTVYNLEVERDNSYVAEMISVHNCFYLKTQGRKRGYIERGETFNMNIQLDRLSLDQLERLAAGEHPSLVLGATAADNRSRARSQTIDALAVTSASDLGAEEEAG